MRAFARLSTTALLVLSTAQLAAAQRTKASATVVTQVPQQGATTVCNQTDGPVAFASATCLNIPVKGGRAIAHGDASLIARTATAAVVLKQTGNQQLVAFAEAQSRVTAKIDVDGGDVNAGDYLVLHFLATLDQHFAGLGTDLFTAELLAARGEGDDSPSFFTRALDGSGNSSHSGNGVRQTQGGFDLLLAFDNFTGSYKYSYGVGVAMGVSSNLPRTSGVQLDIQLEGIDAYNLNDEYLGTVVFHQDATESLHVAPEPVSLALLAPGLLAVLGVARRKRKSPVVSS
jgi:hypothetical protein